MRIFILLLYILSPTMGVALCLIDSEKAAASSLANRDKFQVKVDVDVWVDMIGVQIKAPRLIDGKQMTGFSISRDGSPAGGYILPLSVNPGDDSMTSSFAADRLLLEGATISFSYGDCNAYSYPFQDWLDVEK